MTSWLPTRVTNKWGITNLNTIIDLLYASFFMFYIKEGGADYINLSSDVWSDSNTVLFERKITISSNNM